MLQLSPPQLIQSIKKQAYILVVDDDDINRELLTHLLEDTYTVINADGGQHAIDLLSKRTFDLVLLDVMMPQINGLDVLRYIREHPALEEVPVILISAMSHERDVVNGLQSGANDYITKPMDMGVVLARVKTQLMIKQLLDERKQTIQQLESNDRFRSQVFRIASHDLKSPLGNISMAVHLLRSEIEDNPNANRMLNTITMTIESMQGVITNFLDMVEIQSGKLALKHEPIELHLVIMNVLMLHEYAGERKQIKLTFGNSQGQVSGDSQRLIQSVSNLVSNAIKYSPPGTEVKVWSERHGDHWRVLVKDQGPGIPPDERSQLFQEFVRLSPRPTGGETSTGIGLWIVSHLMGIQGGTVGADFPDEGGSVFWVELPAYRDID